MDRLRISEIISMGCKSKYANNLPKSSEVFLERCKNIRWGQLLYQLRRGISYGALEENVWYDIRFWYLITLMQDTCLLLFTIYSIVFPNVKIALLTVLFGNTFSEYSYYLVIKIQERNLLLRNLSDYYAKQMTVHFIDLWLTYVRMPCSLRGTVGLMWVNLP